MSISLTKDKCPTEDILCVYVDGELPAKYKSYVDAHIEHCQLCKARLSSLQSIKNTSSLDNEALSGALSNETFLNGSFERLQTKLHYERNTKHSLYAKRSWAVFSAKVLAAAAVLAFAVALPLVTLSKKAGVQSNTVTYTPREQFNPIERPRLIENSQGAQNAAFGGVGSFSYPAANATRQRHFVLEAAMPDVIPDVDVFKPNFNKDSINMDFSIDMWYNGRKIVRQSFGIPIKKENAKNFIHKLPHP